MSTWECTKTIKNRAMANSTGLLAITIRDSTKTTKDMAMGK